MEEPQINVRYTGRPRDLRRRYGLSVDQYDEMMRRQDYRCAACGKVRALVVDHCAETGQVRGLLCNSCNVAAGHLLHFPTLARKLADYLERTEDG